MKTDAPSLRIFAGILLLGPLLVFVMLRLIPSLDTTFANQIFHFYIVSFTSLVAFVVAIFVLAGVGLEGAHAVFAVMAFTAMSGIFLLHALATPGIFPGTANHGIGLSARVSLFFGAVFLWLAVRDTGVNWDRRILQNRRNLWLSLAVIYAIYIGIILLAPNMVSMIESQTLLSSIVAFVTIALLLLGSWRAWKMYLAEPKRLTLALAFAMPWLALAQVSQYAAPVWNLSWWMYHILMLAAFIVTMGALVSDYERVMSFRVTRYFIALSVIIGVPVIALLSEAAVRLSGAEAARWPMFGFSMLSVTLLFIILLIVVRRAEAILKERADALEEQKQWRTDFTNLIVHDLKSPLSVTSVSLSLILSGRIEKLPDALKVHVERAQRGNRETLTLVENLLDIEKLEAGALELISTPLDVKKLVEEAVESVQGLAEAYKLKLESSVKQGIAINGDEALLRRVLQNLLNNAIKFTPEGGVIRVEAVPTSTNSVTITVTDSGPGVPVDQRERIFDKFVQVAGIERRGVGLGLTFCKRAVEAHGGRIWVEDAPTKGSRFVFTLPVGQLAAVPLA